MIDMSNLRRIGDGDEEPLRKCAACSMKESCRQQVVAVTLWSKPDREPITEAIPEEAEPFVQCEKAGAQGPGARSQGCRFRRARSEHRRRRHDGQSGRGEGKG